jgi:hypothetical protein
MSDFSLYKSLKTSELTSNAQFSTTGTGPSTTVTGASSAIAQTCRRESYTKIANLSATTSEAIGDARPWPFAAVMVSANITSTGGNAASSTSVYSTVNIYKRTGAGAAVLVASANLSGIVVTQFIPVPLTLVANSANYTLAAGDVLTANVALTSTGTANNIVCTLDWVAEDI